MDIKKLVPWNWFKTDKNYYRVERSFGSFQRVLSLPDDADQEGVKANFKRGVLTISMP